MHFEQCHAHSFIFTYKRSGYLYRSSFIAKKTTRKYKTKFYSLHQRFINDSVKRKTSFFQNILLINKGILEHNVHNRFCLPLVWLMAGFCENYEQKPYIVNDVLVFFPSNSIKFITSRGNRFLIDSDLGLMTPGDSYVGQPERELQGLRFFFLNSLCLA